jgi:hypothetical protein
MFYAFMHEMPYLKKPSLVAREAITFKVRKKYYEK